MGAYSTSLLESTTYVFNPTLITSIACACACAIVSPDARAVSTDARAVSTDANAGSTAPPAVAPELADEFANEVAVVVGEAPGDYLKARRQLEASPALAAPSIERRLADGTLNPAKRRRLLHTLVTIQPLKASPWLRDELHAALATGQDGGPWLSLLRRLPDQGESALITLVGDPKLPVAARGSLLEALVSTSSNPAGFVPLVGRGHRQLERTLRRLLRTRAKLDPTVRAQLLAALDAQIGRGDVPPGVALLRGAIGPVEGAVQAKLIELAVAPETPFDVAVACLSVLAAPRRGSSPPGLLAFAREHLAPARRVETSSTIVGAFALAALRDDDTRALITEFDLLDAEEPRLYALALRRGALGSTGEWLADALDNPWPEVQLAAIERVGTPCDPEAVAVLARRADMVNDPAPTVERAAIRGLGRCGTDAVGRLADLMSKTALPPWKRADAASQVVRVAPERAFEVGEMMRGADDPLSSALLQSLQSLEAPSDELVESACRLASERKQLRAQARRTLKAWGAVERCP